MPWLKNQKNSCHRGGEAIVLASGGRTPAGSPRALPDAGTHEPSPEIRGGNNTQGRKETARPHRRPEETDPQLLDAYIAKKPNMRCAIIFY